MLASKVRTECVSECNDEEYLFLNSKYVCLRTYKIRRFCSEKGIKKNIKGSQAYK